MQLESITSPAPLQQRHFSQTMAFSHINDERFPTLVANQTGAIHPRFPTNSITSRLPPALQMPS